MKKKLISLTLSIVLVLALCLPVTVAARSPACPVCAGSMVLTNRTREIVGYTECPIDSSMQDPVHLITSTFTCQNCGEEKVTSYTQSYCKH